MHVFSFLPISILKLLLIVLREGRWKEIGPPKTLESLEAWQEEVDKSEVAELLVSSDVEEDLFKDSWISRSHLAAGSWSSMTKTFPAFRGTISWKLSQLKLQ